MARQRGFTLVELIVVIVLTGIIGVSITVFFKPTIDGYFDAQRRAGLTDQADTAVQRMSRDVRSAVPNSVRTAGDQCFEFLPTSAGGRYRMATDIDRTDSKPLDITGPVTEFNVLSPLATTPAVGDWVVIGNQNTNDVYSGVNRSAITDVSTANAAVGQATLKVNSQQFPPGYDGGRFVVVPNNGGAPAITYSCTGAGVDAAGNGTGVLSRVSQGFSGTAPTTCPSGGAVLASRVSRCRFIYASNHGATQQSGFVWMELELREAGEAVSLASGVHVSNVP